MRKNIKKALAFVLAFAMCVSLGAIGGLAEGEVAQIGEAGYQTVAAAVEAASAGDTITLIADSSATSTIVISKDLTLDLNGKTFTTSAADGFIVNGGTLTVTDSSPAEGGKIYHTGTDDGVWVRIGTLVLDKGAIESANMTYGAILNSATLTVNRGTIYGASTVDGNGFGIKSNGTVTINGGSVSGSYGALAIFESVATVKGGTLSGPYAVTIYGNGTADSATLNVNGGTITGETYAISGNGTVNETENNGGTTINITKGTITSTGDAAIYQPQNGVLNISGSSTTITGPTGIYQKSGTLNISAGKINGTGAAAEYNPSGNGSNSTGDALVIDNCGYPGGAPTASITGGTFTSTNDKPVGSYASGDGNTPVTEFISGGTFKPKAPDTAYIMDGYEVQSTGTGYTVKAEGSAPVTVDDVLYATFSAAMTAVKDSNGGVTVKLLKNCNAGQAFDAYTVTKDFTLDLNGYTLDRGARVFTIDGATVTIKNGTITGKANSSSAMFIVKNGGVLNVESTAAINAASGTYSAVWVQKNGTLNTAGTITSDKSFAIATSGNEGEGGYTINVTGGEITSTNASAIYHANNGTVNISGGTITGPTGIYQKSGTLNISGGTISGNDAAKEFVHNPSGCNATGDGLVVEVCDYPGGAPTVSITGGTFVSDNAKPVGSYAQDGYTRLAAFLDDGRYNKEPEAALIAEGKMAVQDGNMWIIELAPISESSFTVTLVPTGDADKGESDTIVDAEVGGTVIVDVMLKNNTEADVSFSSAQLLLKLDENLTATSVVLNDEIGGSIALEGTTRKAINYYAPETLGSSSYTLAAGAEIKLGTLTLSVKGSPDNTKKYGETMSISLEDPSDWTCVLVTGGVDEIAPIVVAGEVEIVTQYTITYIDSVDGTETTQTVGYNLQPTPDPETPTKEGFTFAGWQAADGATVYDTSADLPVATEATSYTALWTFNGNIVFIDYAYAGSGNVLMLVGFDNELTDAVKYDGNALFWTDTSYYTDLLKVGEKTFEKAYLYIVPSTTTQAVAYAKLSFDSNGENVKIDRDLDVNLNNKINAGDYGIVDDLLAGRNSAATVQMRLEADTSTSEYKPITMFGSIQDIAAIITGANNF